MPTWLAGTLVFLASGAVLVLEVVALRLIGPYVGVTLQTSSAVIGLALAAIAYGAWTGGWFADRRDPRRLLAPTLVLAGVATGLTLPIVRYAGEALRGSSAPGVLALTAAAVFAPAALLSAVTPLVVKLQLADLRRTGHVVGRLSSVGTLGAVTATLGTGFVLVAALPSSVIMLVLAAALGLAGVGLGLYLHRADRGASDPAVTARGVTSLGLAVAAVGGAALTAVAPNPCTRETAYHCAEVVVDPQRAQGRTLVLNSAAHSYVDLADPTYLRYGYVQWIAALTEAAAPPGTPVQALHLGGGGFTLPRFLEANRPGSDSLVLELDDRLVALDRERLGLRTGPRLRVRTGDARVHLAAEPDASRDLLIGDAFGHLVVPWHLATRELVADVRRVLRPGGRYAQNVIDHPPYRFVRAEVATVAAVFPYVALASTPAAAAGRAGANFVIVASTAPLPMADWTRRLAGLAPGSVRVLDGAQARAFAGGARVLTDDYAPVDQLLLAGG
ncbi:fused MFS/spermidine synthase [Pilimelia terevasa]|uniref:fused MFS/spermidine synthase n=1 Tax=Pilimelia terevasa TaxID=53372 RepID=UPI0016653ABF|nr:fused MFS/spermidine synthase [Pilimelia terevasa]